MTRIRFKGSGPTRPPLSPPSRTPLGMGAESITSPRPAQGPVSHVRRRKCFDSQRPFCYALSRCAILGSRGSPAAADRFSPPARDHRRPFHHADHPVKPFAFCIAVVPPKPENLPGRRHVQDKRAPRASFRVSFLGFSGPRWRTTERDALFVVRLPFAERTSGMGTVATADPPSPEKP